MTSHRIDRVRVSLDAPPHIAEPAMEACSQLFHARLHVLIASVLDDADRVGERRVIDTLTLDLGEIAWHVFADAFCRALAKALSAALADASNAGTVEGHGDVPFAMDETRHTAMFARTHTEAHGDAPFAAEETHTEGASAPANEARDIASARSEVTVATDAGPFSDPDFWPSQDPSAWSDGTLDAWLLERLEQALPAWMARLALRMLREGIARHMARTLRPSTIAALCRAFAAHLSTDVVMAQPDILRICALHYLRQHPDIPVPPPPAGSTIEVPPHCDALLGALFEHHEASSPAMAAWLRMLWTQPATQMALHHRLSPAAFQRLRTWSNMKLRNSMFMCWISL
jgi:hypothetical protein